MPIITISRGSYSRGKEVAEKVARQLGYACTSRDILVEASEEFNIPEVKLTKALHEAPTVLDRFSNGRERYISYIQSAFLTHMKKDNIVYHGLAGHLFLEGITHVLKVRIIASMESRVAEEVNREKSSEEAARYRLSKDDEERRRWSMNLYGKDPWDSRLYDMVLHIDSLSVEDVVEIIANTARKKNFEPTADSVKLLKQRSLLADIHARIVSHSPKTTVRLVEEGIISLGNLEGDMKHDNPTRKQLARQLIDEFTLKDIIFETPPTASGNYINTWYNITSS